MIHSIKIKTWMLPWQRGSRAQFNYALKIRNICAPQRGGSGVWSILVQLAKAGFSCWFCFFFGYIRYNHALLNRNECCERGGRKRLWHGEICIVQNYSKLLGLCHCNVNSKGWWVSLLKYHKPLGCADISIPSGAINFILVNLKQPTVMSPVQESSQQRASIINATWCALMAAGWWSPADDSQGRPVKRHRVLTLSSRGGLLKSRSGHKSVSRLVRDK